MVSLVEKMRHKLIGKEFKTNNCGNCFVVDYKSAMNVTVLFHDPLCAVKCTVDRLKRGTVANPLQRNIYGRGYIGVGKYSSTENRRTYIMWLNMMGRSYDERVHVNQPTYKESEVCEEWWDFQNFAEWCNREKGFDSYDANGRVFQLDKDILLKGNKVYSPETCCFVPMDINFLFTNRVNFRGNEPLGVNFSKRFGKFKAYVNIKGKRKTLGTFSTSEEAFQAYKKAKEAYIKEVAQAWKGKIIDKVYQSLLEWKIEITD